MMETFTIEELVANTWRAIDYEILDRELEGESWIKDTPHDITWERWN